MAYLGYQIVSLATIILAVIFIIYMIISILRKGGIITDFHIMYSMTICIMCIATAILSQINQKGSIATLYYAGAMIWVIICAAVIILWYKINMVQD